LSSIPGKRKRKKRDKERKLKRKKENSEEEEEEPYGLRRIASLLPSDLQNTVQAFYMVGDIKEVEEKADKLAKEMAASDK
jgi:hypothetical protein